MIYINEKFLYDDNLPSAMSEISNWSRIEWGSSFCFFYLWKRLRIQCGFVGKCKKSVGNLWIACW
jgi:hypothetical protein